MEITDQQEPISRLQALRDRWALVRSKVASWWAGLEDRDSTLGLAFVVMVAVGAAAVYRLGPPPSVAAPALAPAAPSASAADADAFAVVLMDFDRRLAALEAAAAIAPATRYTAPAAALTRRAATPTPTPTPAHQPDGGPQAQAWGTTDLDRAINSFNQSIQEHQP